MTTILAEKITPKATCAVVIYFRAGHPPDVCGRPCRGIRTTPDDVMWPVCGIHLRAKRGMVETRLGRYRALREKLP